MSSHVDAMRDGLLLIALFGACYLAFALIAMSQQRHWRVVETQRPHPASLALWMRLAGGAALGASAAIAITRDGWDYGAVLWGTMLSLAALSVVLTLAFRPRGLRVIAHLWGR